jgi:hypothetical protein
MATLGELVDQLKHAAANADAAPEYCGCAKPSDLREAADRLAALDALMPRIEALEARKWDLPVDADDAVLRDLLALR